MMAQSSLLSVAYIHASDRMLFRPPKVAVAAGGGSVNIHSGGYIADPLC